MEVQGRTPLRGHWRLIRNGQLAAEATGGEFQHVVTEPGCYRVEIAVDVAGERRPWILSNPIYITDTTAKIQSP